MCELESKSREYEAQVVAILEVSGTKKGRSQETIGEDTFSDGLSDRRLPRPGEPVEPEDGGLAEVFGPQLDLVQDSLSRTPEAAPAVSVLISSSTSTAAAIQDR